jgi:hypothetical protein
MVDRRVLKPSGRLSRQVNLALPNRTEGINAAEVFSQGMARLNSGIQQTLDNQVVRDSARLGTIAGQNPNYRPRQDNTIAAESFNRAANEVYLSNLEINTRKQLSELHAKNPANPQAFQEAVDAYTSEVLQNLEMENPDLVQPYRESVFRATQPLISDLTTQHQKIVIDQATAESQIALDSSLDGALNMARMMPLNDSSAVDLALERDQYIAQLAKRGPAGEFEFNGQVYEQDPTRPSVYSVEDINNKLRQFDDALTIERAMGEFNRVIKNDGLTSATVAAESFRLQDTPNIEPDVKEIILKRMTTDISRAQRAQRLLDDSSGDLHGAEQDALAKDGYRLQAEGGLNWQWLDANQSDLNKSDYKALVLSMQGGASNDNKDVVISLEDSILSGENAWPLIREAYLSHQLTTGTFRDLRNRNEKVAGSGGSSAGPDSDYKQVSKYLHTVFGGQVQFSKFDPIIVSGAEARRRFDRWYDQTTAETGAVPSYDDQMTQAKSLVNQYMSKIDLTNYFKRTAPQPSGKYRVMNPDFSTLNLDETARKIFADFPEVDSQTDPADYPQELKDELESLTEYENMLDEYNQLKGALDG